MLQIVAVALGDFVVDGLLDPGDGVDQLVPPLLYQLDGEGVLGIDGPNDDHTVLLQLVDGYLLYVLVAEGVVLYGDASGRLRGRQLPRRVHHDHVEVGLGELQLPLDEVVEVEVGHVCADGHCVLGNVGFAH